MLDYVFYQYTLSQLRTHQENNRQLYPNNLAILLQQTTYDFRLASIAQIIIIEKILARLCLTMSFISTPSASSGLIKKTTDNFIPTTWPSAYNKQPMTLGWLRSHRSSLLKKFLPAYA